MLTARTASAEGIVLKRANTGETDRIVTLLTREYGKIAGVAKGVRTLTSSKKSLLEPGNQLRLLLVKTGGLPIISQASLVHQATGSTQTLRGIRSLVQWLEIMDAIFVEEELDEALFQLVLSTRRQCLAPRVNLPQLQHDLDQILQRLGFSHEQHEHTYSITEFVNTIADRPLRGFEYLTVS